MPCCPTSPTSPTDPTTPSAPVAPTAPTAQPSEPQDADTAACPQTGVVIGSICHRALSGPPDELCSLVAHPRGWPTLALGAVGDPRGAFAASVDCGGGLGFWWVAPALTLPKGFALQKVCERPVGFLGFS
jgi:hypothetical protein